MKLAEITPVFNYNQALNKHGEGAIHIRIYHNGKRKLKGLGIHVRPDQWDSNKNRIKSHRKKDDLNARIIGEINRIRDNEDWFNRKNKRYTVSDLLKLREKDDSLTFSEFIEKDLEKRSDITPGTRRNHKVFINKLSEFKSAIAFSDINYQLLNDFESYLRGYTFKKGEVTKKYELTRVVKYLKTLNSYIKRAIKFDLLDERDNPFKRFEWSEYTRAEKQSRRNRRYLDPEEVLRIQCLEFSDKNRHLEKIRDFFVIQCCSGLAYSDMVRLTKADITHKLINGKKAVVIKKRRIKTGETMYIPISEISQVASELLQKYLSDRKFIFDNLTSEYINRELKKIATMAKIDKKVTTHVGRHSCAMWMLYNGLPMEVIAKVLGHSDIRSTQVYTEMNDRVLDQAFNSLRKNM